MKKWANTVLSAGIFMIFLGILLLINIPHFYSDLIAVGLMTIGGVYVIYRIFFDPPANTNATKRERNTFILGVIMFCVSIITVLLNGSVDKNPTPLSVVSAIALLSGLILTIVSAFLSWDRHAP